MNNIYTHLNTNIFEQKKILIVCPKHKMIFSDYKNFGFNVLPTYKRETFFSRVFREVFFRLMIPGKNRFMTKIDDKWDYIILYDSLVTKVYIDYILSIVPSKKIFFFLDNIVSKRGKLIEYIKSKDITIVTLEKKDAAKYGLMVIDDFFNIEYVTKINYQETNQYDIVFFGKDKGRLNDLLKYQKLFEDIGAKTYFHITKTTKLSKNKSIYKKPIKYRELLRYVKNSKCIFEYLQKNQFGLTLRAMESLFFGKKLITNSESIMDYKFYRKENVFIIGHDDINCLSSFLESPILNIDKTIIEYYEYKNVWTRLIYECKGES